MGAGARGLRVTARGGCGSPASAAARRCRPVDARITACECASAASSAPRLPFKVKSLGFRIYGGSLGLACRGGCSGVQVWGLVMRV